MPRINRRDFSRAVTTSLGLSMTKAVAGAKNAVLPGQGSITDVEGIKAGHFTHTARHTGCTMIIMPDSAPTGVDFRGSSHGGQQTILLEPVTSIDSTWGISISGGGAFGMEASWGLVRRLEELKVGYYGGRVPLVTAAAVYDFGIDGDPTIRPDANGGYEAAKNATTGVAFTEGAVGAGAGATVGTMLMSQEFAG